MDIEIAFEIVLDLARENTLDPTTCDDELVYHAQIQDEAIDMVEAYLDKKYVDSLKSML